MEQRLATEARVGQLVCATDATTVATNAPVALTSTSAVTRAAHGCFIAQHFSTISITLRRTQTFLIQHCFMPSAQLPLVTHSVDDSTLRSIPLKRNNLPCHSEIGSQSFTQTRRVPMSTPPCPTAKTSLTSSRRALSCLGGSIPRVDGSR